MNNPIPARPSGQFPQGAVALLRALTVADEESLRSWLQDNPIDTATVGWLAAQGLAPYTYYQLRNAGILPELPAAIYATLRSAYVVAAANQILLSTELAALLEALRPPGVEPIVLKGMALGVTLYPDPATRPTSDLDLLIEKSQIRRLPVKFLYSQQEILTQSRKVAKSQSDFLASWRLGVSRLRLVRVRAVRQALQDRGYRDAGLDQERHQAFTHHLHMWRELAGGSHIAVEAHWRLVHEPGYARHMSLDGMRARTGQVDLGGFSARVLSSTDALIHACAHLLLHHSQDWRLLWLLDLRLLVERYGATWEWPALVEQAREAHLAAALRYWLDLTEAWFGSFLPGSSAHALFRCRQSQRHTGILVTLIPMALGWLLFGGRRLRFAEAALMAVAVLAAPAVLLSTQSHGVHFNFGAIEAEQAS